ncbi:uncharacterized protein A4U43_C07F17510 [Asparagus officinalis]|uniref:Uncharacterized protein n=1 Tax=Asparagus officinalis TaxID=4686 RepID=A0A5P1ECP3_ASPOF|nr:uncharacterized protein A4U43_C07F17510 [Asparagus officinalis]
MAEDETQKKKPKQGGLRTMPFILGSIGNYLGTALATVVSDYTKRRGDWLQDNINRGRLDSYYWLVTVMQVMNLGYYFVCAKYYTFKPLEVEGREEGDLELDAVEGKGSNIDGEEEATESCLVSAQDTRK